MKGIGPVRVWIWEDWGRHGHGMEANRWRCGWLHCCRKMGKWIAFQESHKAALLYIEIEKQGSWLVLWTGSFGADIASGRWAKSV